MFVCIYGNIYACISSIFRDGENLQKRKWYHVVKSWITHCLGTFYRSGVSSESVARERSSHGLNVMVRAVAVTVALDTGSDSSLPKLRAVKEN